MQSCVPAIMFLLFVCCCLVLWYSHAVLADLWLLGSSNPPASASWELAINYTHVPFVSAVSFDLILYFCLRIFFNLYCATPGNLFPVIVWESPDFFLLFQRIFSIELWVDSDFCYSVLSWHGLWLEVCCDLFLCSLGKVNISFSFVIRILYI